MKSYKYISEKNSDSLLSKNKYEDIKDKVIIQSFSPQGQILLFNTVDDFLKFESNLLSHQKIYNEVIFGDDVQKFKLDIDVKNDLLDYFDEIFINKLVKSCVNYVISIVKPLNKKYYLFNSDNKDVKIISRHIIFEFYIYNVDDAKLIYNELMYKLKDKFKNDDYIDKIVDNSVYKKIQNFRLPFHSKIGKNRFKLSDDNINILDGMIKNYTKPVESIEIVNIKHLHKKYIMNIDFLNTFNNNEIDKKTLDKILDISKEFTHGLVVRSVEKNLILFNRKISSMCRICKTIHDNENSIVIVVSDIKFKILCRRNEKNYFEFIYAKSEFTKKINKYFILKRNLNLLNNYNYFEKKIEKNFSKNNIIKYNNKNLNDYDFKDKKILLVHSNVKTGKTKKLKEFLDNNDDIKFVIIISFRILFSIELNSKFKGFKNYLEIKNNKDFSLLITNKIIIQLDSIHKLIIDEIPDLLVLDEVESILSQFTSPYIKHIKLVFEVFLNLLKISKNIICMDANVTERTVNLLNNIFNLDNVLYHYNTFSTINNDKYFIMIDFNIFMTFVNRSLDENHNIIIPVNSLKKGKIIKKYIEQNHKNIKIKIYSSETDDFSKQKDLKDVNKNWMEYNIIIYTPTITAGISFENKHFDKLFGCFTNTSCDIYTVYQMLYRVRNLKLNEVYILFNVLNDSDKEVSITRKELVEEIEYSFNYLKEGLLDYKIIFDINMKRTKIIHNEKDVFYNLWIDNKLIKNSSYYFLIYEFISLLKTNNCIYELIFKLKDSLIIDIKSLNDMVQYDENYKILNMHDITQEEYDILKNTNMLSEYQKIAVKRFFLSKLFNNYDNITIEFLTVFNNKNIIEQCLNLNTVKNFTIRFEEIMEDKLYFIEKNNSGNITSTNTMIFIQSEKYLKFKKILNVIEIIGLNVYNILNTAINFNELIENIENKNKEINSLFNIFNKDLTDDDVDIISKLNKILKNIWGLEIKIIKLNKKGCNHGILVRSNYFNDTYPIKYNPNILE